MAAYFSKYTKRRRASTGSLPLFLGTDCVIMTKDYEPLDCMNFWRSADCTALTSKVTLAGDYLGDIIATQAPSASKLSDVSQFSHFQPLTWPGHKNADDVHNVCQETISCGHKRKSEGDLDQDPAKRAKAIVEKLVDDSSGEKNLADIDLIYVQMVVIDRLLKEKKELVEERRMLLTGSIPGFQDSTATDAKTRSEVSGI